MITTAEPRCLIEAARELGPLIRECAEQIERDRRLPRPLVRAMADAGLFRTWIPETLGGGERDPLTLIRAVEELARVDGSVGWCLMIGASTATLAGYLPESGAREIYGSDPGVVTGSALMPRGRATPVAGGYRVSGRWSFASGSQHCSWLVGHCVVLDGDQPRLDGDGRPVSRLMFLPAADYQVIDTWSVGGLRGTGSHDFAVTDAYVPHDRTLAFGDAPVQPGALYRFPLFGLMASVVSAVALGISRGAIDALVELAGSKSPVNTRNLLRERAMVQVQVAQAEALTRSARALLFETVGDVWETVSAGREASLEQRTILRIAATNASQAAAQAVDLMYNAAGASSIYTTSPLERAFRDVHTATQHALVQPIQYEAAGQLLLGLDVNTALL
jgi:alkylation response protein AidB-like acyl-CoA dehydrogenase